MELQIYLKLKSQVPHLVSSDAITNISNIFYRNHSPIYQPILWPDLSK